MAINKTDLNSYITGDYTLTAKIPGVFGQPQKDSKMSDYETRNSLLSQDFLEKQKRLQQYGYSKEMLQKNPLMSQGSGEYEPMGNRSNVMKTRRVSQADGVHRSTTNLEPPAPSRRFHAQRNSSYANSPDPHSRRMND
jgi:hypothetical protein